MHFMSAKRTGVRKSRADVKVDIFEAPVALRHARIVVRLSTIKHNLDAQYL